jgi:hypothetical protein
MESSDVYSTTRDSTGSNLRPLSTYPRRQETQYPRDDFERPLLTYTIYRIEHVEGLNVNT